MKLDVIFSSDMVFAAGKPIRIYGEGKGYAEITFAGKTMSVFSDEDKWCVDFPAMDYGGPYTLCAVFPDGKADFSGIYIGDVYLLAGQSNMQVQLDTINFSAEKYVSQPRLHFFTTENFERECESFFPEDGWMLCEKQTAGKRAALPYLVGNALCNKKDVHVGIIMCYRGASVIESWVPEGTFEKLGINIPPENKYIDHTLDLFAAWNRDGVLYSHSLSQVIPFSLSGVVWYQGESDADGEETAVYADELCALIDVWRRDFCDELLPFAVVQIADFDGRAGDGWTALQNAQLEVQKMRKNVKTVISRDVCETDDIHPPTKHILAERIADALVSTNNQ